MITTFIVLSFIFCMGGGVNKDKKYESATSVCRLLAILFLILTIVSVN